MIPTCSTKETETKMSLMVRRHPPMIQSEFEDDSDGESWWKFRLGADDTMKRRGP